MRLVTGIALIVAGLVGWLYDAHVRRQRAWDRPAWMLNPPARLAFATARRAMVVGGWVLIALDSRWAAAVVAAVLVVAWGHMRWVRSERCMIGRLKMELEALRRRDPTRGEQELMSELVLTRHPEWGPELVAQIVAGHPSPEALARIVARMERGWTSVE